MNHREMAEFLLKLRDRNEMPINEDEYYLISEIADELISFGKGDLVKMIWIKCSDKLPTEKDGKVLISMPNGEVETGGYSEYSERWYKGDMMGVGGDDPVAWMPLPDPYYE